MYREYSNEEKQKVLQALADARHKIVREATSPENFADNMHKHTIKTFRRLVANRMFAPEAIHLIYQAQEHMQMESDAMDAALKENRDGPDKTD